MKSIFADRILRGKVAFITGGGTGITGGVARALAEAGANVALVSRRMEHLEAAAAAINDARRGSLSVTVGVDGSASVSEGKRSSSATVTQGSSSHLGEAFA